MPQTVGIFANPWNFAFIGAAFASQVDLLVLMSHLGINADRQIARDFPELDVILGSHTHHLFEKGEVINGVQIGAAGKFGLTLAKSKWS